jgi:UDP-glucose 4-epimerase
VGDGEQRRDFTHIDDIVDGLIKCVGKEHKGEIFELGSGKNYSINDVADMFGSDYPKKYIPSRPGEYDMTLCTDTKAFEKLNWTSECNLVDYIKQWVKGI